MVDILAGFAIPSHDIAEALGITKPTLFKHCAREMKSGGAKVQAKLVTNLLRLASGSDGTALKAIIFSLSCRFGWSAYVPRPTEPKPLGKKEKANLEAQTAHQDHPGWDQLVH